MESVEWSHLWGVGGQGHHDPTVAHGQKVPVARSPPTMPKPEISWSAVTVTKAFRSASVIYKARSFIWVPVAKALTLWLGRWGIGKRFPKVNLGTYYPMVDLRVPSCWAFLSSSGMKNGSPNIFFQQNDYICRPKLEPPTW